jgi:hypothetical protein
MNLREQLDNFYQTYNIPEEGGIDDKTFEVPLPFFTLVLPNFSWRKRMLYVHDLEHILNNQDTTWQGEIFIASWEISTGFFKNFPILLFPLWTMGWGLWAHPKSVFRGFRTGHTDKGIAHLDIEKSKLLELDLFQLQQLTLKKRPNRSRSFYLFKFVGWSLLSQIAFFLPLILFLVITFALNH